MTNFEFFAFMFVNAKNYCVEKLHFQIKRKRAGKPAFKILPSWRFTMKHVTQLFSAFFLTLVVLSSVGCASTDTRSGTGEYIDDSVITSKVRAALLNEPNLNSVDINVETFKGVVQLSGFVNSQAQINRALAVTRTIGGVYSVKNDMRLK